MGTIPPLKRQLAETVLSKYCRNKVPAEYQDELRITFEFRGSNVTLYENRPAAFGQPGWTKLSIAQLRYSEEDNNWTLYCADRNGRWHLYMECDPEKDMDKLIKEIDEDPTGIFYG
jgi:hypothetical protein